MLDIPGILDRLAVDRPVFHSEADFQHALAWQIHRENPTARIRLETRPQRGIRLDLLVDLFGERTAIELKYFIRRFTAVVHDELYDLPNQGAHDILATTSSRTSSEWRHASVVALPVTDGPWP